MTFTKTDFSALIDSDAWVLQQMMKLPSDPESTVSISGNNVTISIMTNIAMGQMQTAVRDYRSRLIPVMIVLAQKIYAELFRLFLGNLGITVGNRHFDVEEKIKTILSTGTPEIWGPFANQDKFMDWWSGVFNYEKLRLSRNVILHKEYTYTGGRVVISGTEGELLNWAEDDALNFSQLVLDMYERNRA